MFECVHSTKTQKQASAARFRQERISFQCKTFEISTDRASKVKLSLTACLDAHLNPLPQRNSAPPQTCCWINANGQPGEAAIEK